MGFVHLHVHSEFTFRESTIRVERLPGRVQELGMDAVALTDRGGLHGMIRFARAARGVGIKPIAGVEIDLAPETYPEIGPTGSRPIRLSLLARNGQGFRSLTALSSIRRRSRRGLTLEQLQAHREGLILLSGGLSGPISQLIVRQKVDDVYGVASELAGLMEEDGFYLEIQRVGHPAEEWVISVLADFATRLSIPLVATHDCRFLTSQDGGLLHRLQSEGSSFHSEIQGEELHRLHLLSPEEMVRAFQATPEAVEEAGRLAARCADVIPDRLVSKGPSGSGPGGPALEELARRALEAEPGFRHPRYVQRLGEELALVSRCDTEPEILRVLEAVQQIRQGGGVVGPLLDPFGHTLLARVLGISELDPLEDGLRPERYFNPQSSEEPGPLVLTMDRKGRDLLMGLLAGQDGTALPVALVDRSLDREILIRLVVGWGHPEEDVRRVVGPGVRGEDRMASLLRAFPPPEESEDLEEAVRQVTELLTGLPESVLAHPSALVGFPDEVADRLPTFVDAPSPRALQWTAEDLIGLGLPAVHALEVENLGLIRRVGQRIGLQEIPVKDGTTYEMLGRGEVLGVYGFEGEEAQELAREPWPHTLTGLAALLAILQPRRRPLVERYRDGLRRSREIPKRIRSILGPTGGILLFPDQFIELAVELAGMPPRRADALLRRISTEPDESSPLEERLIRMTVRHGMPEPDARGFFQGLLTTSGHLSEKNRALGAALLAYKTAYLKCHHPVAFLGEWFRQLLSWGGLGEGYRRALAERYVDEALRLGIALEGDPWSATQAEPDPKEGRIRFSQGAPETS